MKRFDGLKSGLLAVLAAAIVAVPIAVLAKEEKVKLEDCPAAVQKALQDNAAGTVTEIEKETKKDGTVVYEADVKKADGGETEITVAEDGKVIGIENEDDDDDESGED